MQQIRVRTLTLAAIRVPVKSELEMKVKTIATMIFDVIAGVRQKYIPSINP